MTGLEFSGVRFAYGSSRTIFESADWSFEPGLMHAVMGPSGSGKTTLFRLASGELHPDEGRVLIEGQDLTLMDSVVLRRTLVARVHQDYRLVPFLDALDNVRLPQEIAGTLRANPTRARELLERLGLGERLHGPVERLSGGEQQRVALARALVGSPRMILADEPTGALDEEATELIATLLGQVAQEWGIVVVVATHDQDVAAHADAVVRIHSRHLFAA